MRKRDLLVRLTMLSGGKWASCGEELVDTRLGSETRRLQCRKARWVKLITCNAWHLVNSPSFPGLQRQQIRRDPSIWARLNSSASEGRAWCELAISRTIAVGRRRVPSFQPQVKADTVAGWQLNSSHLVCLVGRTWQGDARPSLSVLRLSFTCDSLLAYVISCSTFLIPHSSSICFPAVHQELFSFTVAQIPSYDTQLCEDRVQSASFQRIHHDKISNERTFAAFVDPSRKVGTPAY